MLSKIKLILKESIYREPIQLSPPRSGSTLLWNCLKIYHGNTRKLHNFDQLNKPLWRTKLFITIRNPVDIVCSLLRISENNFDSRNIYKTVNKLKGFNLELYPKLYSRNNCIFFKYEKFYKNYDYIFLKLDKVFGPISDASKQSLINSFSIDNVSKISDVYKTFESYDSETNIHGNHISRFKGKPNSYSELVSDDDIHYIKDNFQEFMKFFDYIV